MPCSWAQLTWQAVSCQILDRQLINVFASLGDELRVLGLNSGPPFLVRRSARLCQPPLPPSRRPPQSANAT
eukprot:1903484-Amphidinium_carterae.1